jgi:excisionase family DNA binding protein
MKTGAAREWFTILEAAELTKLSPATLWRRIRMGQMRAWQPGGKRTAVRIHRSELVPTPFETTATSAAPSQNTIPPNAGVSDSGNPPTKKPNLRRPHWQRGQ